MSNNNAPVEDGNKLIAEFMGAEWKKDDYGDFGFFFPDNSHRPTAAFALKYHSSWDWLMPVVEKIETLKGEDGRGEVEYVVTIEQTQCIISLGGEGEIVYEQAFDTGKTKREMVWQAVVQFIRWYNTQTSKQ